MQRPDMTSALLLLTTSLVMLALQLGATVSTSSARVSTTSRPWRERHRQRKLVLHGFQLSCVGVIAQTLSHPIDCTDCENVENLIFRSHLPANAKTVLCPESMNIAHVSYAIAFAKDIILQAIIDGSYSLLSIFVHSRPLQLEFISMNVLRLSVLLAPL
jgi:hypothetical protein